jgi:type VI secretion system ImpM family protein
MELSMSCQPVTRWLFGKLPAQGDFVARGLDHPSRDSLDRWLSAEMETAKGKFPDFEARYDQAPAWNFVECDADGQWSGGALCASIDRAGRRFPLLMAAPAVDAAAAVAISGACLEALYGALTWNWDADVLHSAELDPVSLPWTPASTEWALLGEDGPAYTATDRFPGGIVSIMLEMSQ